MCAIELVDFSVKKKIGPLAYVIAGLKALREKKTKIMVRADGQNFSGELVLIGNGRFYGGLFGFFQRRICATDFWTFAFFRRRTG